MSERVGEISAGQNKSRHHYDREAHLQMVVMLCLAGHTRAGACDSMCFMFVLCALVCLWMKKRETRCVCYSHTNRNAFKATQNH